MRPARSRAAGQAEREGGSKPCERQQHAATAEGDIAAMIFRRTVARRRLSSQKNRCVAKISYPDIITPYSLSSKLLPGKAAEHGL